MMGNKRNRRKMVSTHSRLKAVVGIVSKNDKDNGFNTQPPEGGWLVSQIGSDWLNGFNTQPPEGG